MPALQPQQKLTTLKQYEALPEDMRAEVFDGQIYYMSNPSQDHQTISIELSTILNTYIRSKQGSCRVFHTPFDVKLNDAPDFTIEIVSPSNPSDDYIRKLYYYKNAGVREYWIVDPRRKIVIVNYFEGNILDVHYSFDSTIKVNIYEDLYINFSDIAEQLTI